MLGEGLRAGLRYLGIAHRTICYVEREAHAGAVLVARMEEGSLDPAPIWSDLLTFDGGRFRGAVDGIAAGFPCQDLSLAGRRAGLDGARSGLFFDILDIADASGAWFLFLENVTGIATATASVVDEAEGALDERAAARVLGELADRGWHAEWLTLPASDVGASHGRARWFCWAWRQVENTNIDRASERPQGRRGDAAGISAPGGSDYGCDAGANVADPKGQRGREWERTERQRRAQAEGASDPMADATSGHRGQQPRPDQRGLSQPDGGTAESAPMGYTNQQRTHRSGPPGQQTGCIESAQPGKRMANPTGDGWHEGRPQSSGEQGRFDAAECSGSVPCEFCGYEFPEHLGRYGCPNCEGDGLGVGLADTSGTGREGPELGSPCDDERHGPDAHGSASELCGLFAPGPADPRWGAILAQYPELAPALEPTFRQLVNGLAFDMGDSRAARLKCVGNGVVPLCAATAAVVLFRRSALINNAQPAMNNVAETEEV